MTNNTILICEPVHNGEVHHQVNSCFIQMISNLYPEYEIVIRAEKKHIYALKNNLTKEQNNNINYLSFEQYYDQKKYNWIKRIIGECNQILKTLFIGEKIGSELFIWTCLFPTGHFFLNLILLFKKNKRHVIILHGELEYLKLRNKKKSILLFGAILWFGLVLSNSKIKYIVLGDNIKKTLTKILINRVSKKIYSILHPYNYNNAPQKKLLYDNKKLIIGSIGTQMISKNSNYIYTLANNFIEEIIQKNITFRTIGKILPELIPYETEFVEKIHSMNFVLQEEFEKEISKLDFIIFFYDNHSYQLCASGAIFEAIRMDIPIISIQNDYFKWIFNTYGDMGFLCENLETIKDVVESLKQGLLKEEIKDFKKNISKFKLDNNLQHLTIKLKSII